MRPLWRSPSTGAPATTRWCCGPAASSARRRSASSWCGPTGCDPEVPLLVLTTNTWNAYNDFGGDNLYTGGTQVSFARPMARASCASRPDPAAGGGGRRARPGMAAHVHYLLDHGFSQWAGSAGWPNAELAFVRWARAGYELDYALNADLETVPGLLDGRRLYLSVGHDEYWTWAMRDAVESFVAGGRQRRLPVGQHQLLAGPPGGRGPDDGGLQAAVRVRSRCSGPTDAERLTSLWSDQLVGRPENHMTGVSFARGGYHRIGRAVAVGRRRLHRLPTRPLGVRRHRGRLRRPDRRRLGGGRLRVRRLRLHRPRRAAPSRPAPTARRPTSPILGLAPAHPFDRVTSVRPVADGERSEVEFHAWRVLGDDGPEAVARLEHGHAVMGVHQPGGHRVHGRLHRVGLGPGRSPDPVIEQITRNLLDRLTADPPDLAAAGVRRRAWAWPGSGRSRGSSAARPRSRGCRRGRGGPRPCGARRPGWPGSSAWPAP